MDGVDEYPATVTELLGYPSAGGELAASLKERLISDSRPGVAAKYAVNLGRPADVLCAAAADARMLMLVVGSRGRGGFEGLLLGSVSTQCADRANCPVLVVPDRN